MYRWNDFEKITAVTSKRTGGFSKGDYASMNLALHVGDDKDTVMRNRAYFFGKSEVNMTRENSVFVAQNHSTIVKKVTFKDAGRGFDDFNDGIKADALYTNEPGLNLAIYHADCVPVFIYVPNHNIVGIIHAGEQGSVGNITGILVRKLFQEGIKPEEIYAHIGPSASLGHRIITKKRAFELAALGDNVIKAIKATTPQYFLDLPLLNTLQLRSLGIPLKNISLSEICTYQNNDQYYSYARSKVTGRNISFIRLN
ncbi:MAG: peptidoglycan editing factor PgeF [Bacilli bacterium]|jgi:YfiH family protein